MRTSGWAENFSHRENENQTSQLTVVLENIYKFYVYAVFDRHAVVVGNAHVERVNKHQVHAEDLDARGAGRGRLGERKVLEYVVDLLDARRAVPREVAGDARRDLVGHELGAGKRDRRETRICDERREETDLCVEQRREERNRRAVILCEQC